MTAQNGDWIDTDIPQAREFQSCIKCGLCLDSCPTFQETGRELESPRGRVQLIAAAARGDVPLVEGPLTRTMFSCLDCRACETACPSGVPIGTLIEKARAQIIERYPAATPRWTYWVHAVIGHPQRLYWVREAVRISQHRRLWRLMAKFPVLPASVRQIAKTLRPLPDTTLRRMHPPLARSASNNSPRVQLFLGCVMDAIFADAHQATQRVLARHGCEVSVPNSQRCCGALAVHAGHRDEARRLARINIEQFLEDDADYVVTNAGGCGAALLEYPEWLRDDPQYFERARQFSNKVRDVLQVLEIVGFRPPTGNFPHTVTYQGSCHLHHVMKVGNMPERVLEAIPGLTYKAMPDAIRCCGSAGIYNLTHPEMADALLRQKMLDIPHGTEIIATGNPGCWLQLEQGVSRFGPSVKVMHLIQVLDKSYMGESDEQGITPTKRAPP